MVLYFVTGEVNISVSGVVKFSPKAPKLVRNEIVVRLLDSFSNPVMSEISKLSLVLTLVNKPGFSNWMFVDNKDGSYIGHYLAMEVGTYEMCVLFEGKHFSPCPFTVNVYGSKLALLQASRASYFLFHLIEQIFASNVCQVNIFLKHMMIKSLFGRMNRFRSMYWKMTTLPVPTQVLSNSRK